MITRQGFLRAACVLALVAIGTGPALAQDAIKTGVFEGASGHATSGGVQIVAIDGKFVIRLGADFVNDGTAPDITVALGKDGYDDATNLGKLRQTSGAQDYTLPAGIDPANYNQVLIWCKKFAVPLGVAPLG